MKLYLDDVRSAPEGWTLVRTAQETIFILSTVNVQELSLDHDLGNDDYGTNSSGYIEYTTEEKVINGVKIVLITPKV